MRFGLSMIQTLLLVLQLTTIQTELATANNRKQQLEIELSNVRAELRDHKQHLRDAINRLSDLQRQLQDSHAEKNRLSDKIFTLEKVSCCILLLFCIFSCFKGNYFYSLVTSNFNRNFSFIIWNKRLKLFIDFMHISIKHMLGFLANDSHDLRNDSFPHFSY